VIKGKPKAVVKKKPAAKVEEEESKEDEVMGEEEEEEEENADGEDMNEEGEEEEQDQGLDPKAKAAAYRKFWNKLGSAPKAVQDKVNEIKTLSWHAGKRQQLQNLALAYANGGWENKVFKSIETLEEERSRSKQVKAIPKVLMRAKCGGEEAFQQAGTCKHMCFI
jgi:hypothetical protein